jgi:hypothetical protein
MLAKPVKTQVLIDCIEKKLAETSPGSLSD